MRIVVQRIDAPRVAGAMVVRVADAVDRRVAQVHVRARHVDLEAQHMRAVGELARRASGGTARGSPRRCGPGTGSAMPASVSVPRVARISAADWLSTYASPCSMNHSANAYSVVVIVRRVVEMRSPVVAEPAHRLLDRFLVLDVLLERIGVVEAQVTGPAVLLGEPEIEQHRLRMAVMQVAVRLRRKAGDDAPAVLAGAVVVGDDGAQEVRRGRGRAPGPRTSARRASVLRCSTHCDVFMDKR